MPGKRPRQIQRTISMSQLGAARFPQGLHGDTGFAHRGHSCPPTQEFFHGFMEPCLEAGEPASPLSSMEENANTMVVDSSAEESLFASRTLQPGVLLPAHHTANLGVEALAHTSGYQWSHLPHPQSKGVDNPLFLRRRLDMGGSDRPTHFLDICYLCSKLLGHGRDVYIYRGDRAFCSVECRHMQIMADERREKGVLTGAKDGSVTSQASETPNANQVETVAAA
ncbi:hypothetical protein GOP47_0028254 [Adiantum capillus-veneris]|nr:hypothetical protein GOP47_0028254 [Adiantum capillus-veneris]